MKHYCATITWNIVSESQSLTIENNNTSAVLYFSYHILREEAGKLQYMQVVEWWKALSHIMWKTH